jgi:thioesterase domain-containing protein
MACQLRAQGEDVALLVLISCSPPNSDYETTRFRWSLPWMFKFCRNVGFWLTSFLVRWDSQERRNFIRWKARLVWKKVTSLFTTKDADPQQEEVEQMIDLSAVGADQRRLWDSHMQAMIRHYPRPYDGKTVLIRSAAHQFLSSFDDQCGWGELVSGGVDVRIVPGDHGRVLEEPFVACVADELRQCVNAQVGEACQEGIA